MNNVPRKPVRRDNADTAAIERSLIGSVLLDPIELDRVSGIVSGCDFNDADYGKFFSVLIDRRDAGLPTSDPTLLLEVGRSIFGRGAAATIAELFEHEPTATHARYYAEKTKEASRLRSLHNVAAEIAARCTIATETSETVTAYAESQLAAIGTEAANKPVRMHSAGIDLISELREPQTRRPVMTGIVSIDNVAGGLLPGELEIIAARPANGKTSFAMQIAKRTAETGRHVLFVSLEMRATELVARTLCGMTKIDSRRLRRGELGASEIERIASANEELTKLPLSIFDPPQASMQRIRAVAKMQQAAIGLELLVVDYIGLIQARDNRQPRHEQVAEITAALKRLAKELNIPVIALCQLNREAEKCEPRLSHLRESGSIEQDADVVLFLHRVDQTNEFKLIIGKHRHGDTGAITITFDASATKFSDVATQRFSEFD